MNRRGSTYECPDMAAMMKRVARALVRRAADGDLEALSALRDVDNAVGEAIVQAARAAHYGRFRYSWNEIARELGVTRQAAQKRFADDALDEQQASRPTLDDLPMGGCPTAATHHRHLTVGDPVCENQRERAS